MDSAWPEATLANLKAAAFTKYDVFFRNANIIELNVHVTVWCIVLAEHVHGP